jgi:hypothetical protein
MSKKKRSLQGGEELGCHGIVYEDAGIAGCADHSLVALQAVVPDTAGAFE